METYSPDNPHPLCIRQEKLNFESIKSNIRSIDIFRSFSDPVKGVRVKDRTYFFKVFRKCFVGTEAVVWLRTTYNLRSEEEAVAVGRWLGEEGVLTHFVCQHFF